MMFDQFMTETLRLIKKDLDIIEGIKANIQDKIFINNVKLPVVEGDIFEHTNPAGIKEFLKVTDVIYHNYPPLEHIEIQYKKSYINPLGQ